MQRELELDTTFEMSIKEKLLGEKDILLARLKGGALTKKPGLSIVDQIRIVTAIPELARNIISFCATQSRIILEAISTTLEGFLNNYPIRELTSLTIKMAIKKGFPY